jgi:hypothetical protein
MRPPIPTHAALAAGPADPADPADPAADSPPRVTILRGTIPTYTAQVSHIARNCGDIVLVDVRDLNGKLLRATGGNVHHLQLRAKNRTGLIMSSQGYGGELVVDMAGFDAGAYPSEPHR